MASRANAQTVTNGERWAEDEHEEWTHAQVCEPILSGSGRRPLVLIRLILRPASPTATTGTFPVFPASESPYGCARRMGLL
mmetsp:Transcript_15004/g.56907  ORF Transcript_15004/g.56907 Transcript_15004/m.56907 type:complete len:81 (-) Transcript_15004:289-531(-)|eukprot:scaffold1654_cov258-Pinguiococcus_pyrenoidosus.AAC.2